MSKIPEEGFREIIASVLSDLMKNNATCDSTEVSKIFLFFENEFMQLREQFSSISREQIEEAVAATKLHKNVVVSCAGG